jgi:hypothetical protein
MSLPSRLTALLTSLTPDQVQALPPAARQLLSDQLQRVHRMIDGARIVNGARKATAPMSPRSGVLADLHDGRGRQ